LTDAGLGCPDWPGCYGRMVLPNSGPSLQQAQQAYPSLPIVPHKAWAEMVHRYVAGALGILILILAVWAIVNRRRGIQNLIVTPLLLVGVLIFQAVLGMWTVTLKLLPLVVTAHLLGGMSIAGLLSWMTAATSNSVIPRLDEPSRSKFADNDWLKLKVLTLIGLMILIIQLFLGAWTSTNYSALACGADFPSCLGSFWPNMDWRHAFNILSPVGPNYEGGLLNMAARTAIHMAHRYWALITFLYLSGLSLLLLSSKVYSSWRNLAIILLSLLCLQVLLGIVNVIKLLPLANAVAHNGVAVLLLITIILLLERVSRRANKTA
jgi:cytochrome c oxidase assembly protein subunit 15